MSVDPLADDYPGWNPYHYTWNNPLKFIDPDGRKGVWHEDGDDNWVADKGDGAETLARDAGITRKEAYRIMDEQGHGTYVDQSDGVTKSKIHPGEKVNINSAECMQTHKESKEFENSIISSEIGENKKRVSRINKSLDSLKEIDQNAQDGLDGKHDGLGGRNAGYSIHKFGEKFKVGNEMKKLKGIKDSLIKVNKKLEKKKVK